MTKEIIKQTFPLYYLGKMDESQKVVEITDGPFPSMKEADDTRDRKYGWGSSDYRIMKTEQLFEEVKE